MLFALICDDKPGAAALRLRTRPQHVEYLRSLGSRLAFAGPFLGADEAPTGSLLVVDAPSAADARGIADADPYALAGLFAAVTVRRWNWTINKPGSKEAV